MSIDSPFDVQATFPPPPEPRPAPPPKPAKPTPTPTDKSSGRLRKVVVALALVAVALGVLVLFAPAIAARTFLKDRIVAAAAGSIDGTLTVDSLDLGWLAPVRLEGVTLTGPQGELVAKVPVVRTEKTLLALARAGGEYGTVTVERPELRVVIDGDSSNLERALDKILNAPEEPKSATRPGVTVKIEGGTATLSHKQLAGEAKFDNLNATVDVPRDAGQPISVAGQFSAAGTPGGAAFDVKAGEALDATVRAHALPLESFAALVRRFGKGAEVKGTLGGDVHAGRSAGVLALRGHAAIDGLDAVGPWSDGQHLTAKRLLASADEVRVGNDQLALKNASVESDVGHLRATAEISTAAPVNELFSTPGLDVDLDLDVARLANAAPKLLRLKPGTSLTEGTLRASAESHRNGGHVVWTGHLETSALRGTRDGKPIGWEKPMIVNGVGHLRDADGLPVFEKLTWQADFISLIAAGSVEQFAANANIDFDRLGARLAEFIDLGGSSLGGTGALAVTCNPGPGGTFRFGATLGATDFRYTDIRGHQVREPKLTATLVASGKYAPKQPLRLDVAAATLEAAPDKLSAELVTPIPDLKNFTAGKARLALDGELGRWYARAAEFSPSLERYKVGGRGPVRATVAVTPSRYELTSATADLQNVTFDGAGVSLNEETLRVETGATYDRMAKTLALTDVLVHGPTAVVKTRRADIQFDPVAVKTDAQLTANLNRVQKAFKLQSSPVNGLAIGTVKLEPQNGPTVFDADFRVTDLIYGPPADPTWAEKWVTVKTLGYYDGAKDKLDLRDVELARDGLAVKGTALLDDLSTAMRLDSKGTLSYDLDRLNPQLKNLLGPTASASGRGSRPFSVVGPLTNLDALSAQAGLNWDQLRAYGFTVDKGELTATARGGDLRITPIEAGFGGGTVRVEPKIDLTSPNHDLSLKPGKLVERTRLTPEACASAIGYALPAFANAAQATGEVSFDLGDNRIPLTKPESGSGRGVLTVHSAEVSAGPVIEKIMTALGAERTTMKLSGEQQVPVAFEKGRVYHDQFKLMLGKTEVVSSGSVGIDKTVDLQLDMPVPPKFLTGVLANNPVLRESLAKQRIKVPVRGTLSQPAIDEGAVARAVQGLIRGTAQDAVRDNVGKVEDKLRDKLRGELEKALPFGRRK